MEGTLSVILYKAKLTRDTEFFGKMDPFVELQIGQNHTWRSKVNENGG